MRTVLAVLVLTLMALPASAQPPSLTIPDGQNGQSAFSKKIPPANSLLPAASTGLLGEGPERGVPSGHGLGGVAGPSPAAV